MAVIRLKPNVYLERFGWKKGRDDLWRHTPDFGGSFSRQNALLITQVASGLVDSSGVNRRWPGAVRGLGMWVEKALKFSPDLLENRLDAPPIHPPRYTETASPKPVVDFLFEQAWRPVTGEVGLWEHHRYPDDHFTTEQALLDEVTAGRELFAAAKAAMESNSAAADYYQRLCHRTSSLLCAVIERGDKHAQRTIRSERAELEEQSIRLQIPYASRERADEIVERNRTKEPCQARRQHPLSSDFYVPCSLVEGHDGEHQTEDGLEWGDDNEYALASGQGEDLPLRQSLKEVPSALVYRDYCNTCGVERGQKHEERCHLTGEVGAWSGIQEVDPDVEACKKLIELGQVDTIFERLDADGWQQHPELPTVWRSPVNLLWLDVMENRDEIEKQLERYPRKASPSVEESVSDREAADSDQKPENAAGTHQERIKTPLSTVRHAEAEALHPSEPSVASRTHAYEGHNSAANLDQADHYGLVDERGTFQGITVHRRPWIEGLEGFEPECDREGCGQKVTRTTPAGRFCEYGHRQQEVRAKVEAVFKFKDKATPAIQSVRTEADLYRDLQSGDIPVPGTLEHPPGILRPVNAKSLNEIQSPQTGALVRVPDGVYVYQGAGKWAKL